MTDEERKISYVLGMCQRVERNFTLREIIARVMQERPEMVIEFADAWGVLLKRKLVRVAESGPPSLYEVVLRHED